jgi:hypothetical protein
MKRREFFEKAGMGSAALVSLPVVGGSRNGAAGQEQEHGHDGRQNDMDGPLSAVEVSFGQWNISTNNPLDRFPNVSDRTRNNHQLIPGTAEVRAGGAVKFIIAGFHHILIYGDGMMPSDINKSLTQSVTVPPGPPLINDPVGRIYRGLDPSVMPLLPGTPAKPATPTTPATPGTPAMTTQDRVETVRFMNPGKFLVMCGVLPHFFDAATNQFVMFGFVRVRK